VTDLDEALALENDAGERRSARPPRAIGYRGDGAIDPSSWAAFYELHVEQDTVLKRRAPTPAW